MKRIILGLGVLLMLGQNGFALTDAEYDKLITNETDPMWKQIYRCNKAAEHYKSSSVDICLQAIKLLKNNGWKEKDYQIMFLNTGLLYDESKGDKLNAYKYYMKASKLGNIQAQKNLNIMCKESPWACK